MVWEELQILGSNNKMRVKLGKGQLIHQGKMNENTDMHKEEKNKEKKVFWEGPVGKELRLDSSYHPGDLVL